MLDRAGTLKGYTLHCLDGEIGRVKEFYFDDRHWAVRYLVADTGSWLAERQVLISPHALGAIDRDKHHIAVDLTRKQVEDSPALETDLPVSKQFQEAYYGHFGWPTYWSGPYMWGAYPSIVRERAERITLDDNEGAWDPHLRSTHDVDGHRVEATDGAIGHIEDFVIDSDTWAIRYLVINTRNWWPGKHVLVSPKWIERIVWNESKVVVNLTRAAIKGAPEYSEGLLLNRDYETKLHHHYARQGYWVEEHAGVGAP
jgi:uncharacterized protein YrrD